MNDQRKSLDEELRIVHATDLHPDGGIAFAHSVALASRGDGSLFSLHANPADQEAVRRMPEASELIEEWKSKGGKNELAPAEFHKVSHSCCDDPVDTLLDAMNDILPNLLIVGKHPVEGMFKFLHTSVSESLALNAHIPALFLPIG
ncbi:MAG: universal stress protein, partial [Myxococcota bacterium]